MGLVSQRQNAISPNVVPHDIRDKWDTRALSFKEDLPAFLRSLRHRNSCSIWGFGLIIRKAMLGKDKAWNEKSRLSGS
jgi:hypothetical protein